MKKSFMDDPKSWGKWEDPGQVATAPTSEPSALPKPLTLADIRVGEEYVTLRRYHDRVFEERYWTMLRVIDLREDRGPSELGGILLRIKEWSPEWYTAHQNILPQDYGLLPSVGLWNKGYRTFLATPECIALIKGIVEQQDHAAYSALTGVKARLQGECPLPDQGTLSFSRTFGKGTLQSPSDEFLRGFEDLLKAKG